MAGIHLDACKRTAILHGNSLLLRTATDSRSCRSTSRHPNALRCNAGALPTELHAHICADSKIRLRRVLLNGSPPAYPGSREPHHFPSRACLTPQAVPGALLVPLGCRLEVACPRRQMLTRNIFIQRDAQTRPVRHLDPSVVHDRRFHIFLRH